MKNYFLLMFISSISWSIFAQKHDQVWLTGYSSNTIDSTFGGTSIDFGSIPPEITYEFRDMWLYLTSASICDKEGNLLFYTNGTWIANSLHEQMINGDNIGPDPTHQASSDFGASLGQGAIILPFPDSSNFYVMIHVERTAGGTLGFNTSVPHCLYSFIDMSNGFGEVIEKNQVIIEDKLDYGKITATKHANGRDWWILVPKFFSNKYYRLLLSPNGVENQGVQEIGDIVISGIGQAFFSPDGSKYARVSFYRFDTIAQIAIYDFNRCNGELSNPYHIDIDTVTINNSTTEKYSWFSGGLTFSSNSRFLYFLDYFNIIQYDLLSSDIFASGELVATYDGFIDPESNAPINFMYGHLTPNEEIYVIPSATGSSYFSVIRSPDEFGVSCNIEQHAIELPTRNSRTLPNFPNFRLKAEINSPCDTLRPIAQFSQTPNALDITFTDESQRTPTEWLWTFGDGDSSTLQNPQHLYAQQGTYEVCLIVSNEAGSDTTCQMIEIILDGLEELARAQQIKISPNPTSGYLMVELPKERSDDWEMVFYDAYGRVLLGKELPQGVENVNVLLSDFAAGVYFYKIRNGREVVKTGKVVKE